MKETVSIGEAAIILDVSTNTLRKYDKLGIVPCSRGANGYRYFNVSDLFTFKSEMRKFKWKGQALGLILFRLKQQKEKAGTK